MSKVLNKTPGVDLQLGLQRRNVTGCELVTNHFVYDWWCGGEELYSVVTFVAGDFWLLVELFCYFLHRRFF